MGNSNMHAQHEKNFDPSPPPSRLPNVVVGTGPPPQGVEFYFSKTPHMCVQNDQSEEGII